MSNALGMMINMFRKSKAYKRFCAHNNEYRGVDKDISVLLLFKVINEKKIQSINDIDPLYTIISYNMFILAKDSSKNFTTR